MPRQRRLYRAEIYRQLERLKRKWRKLDFCDFVLRAEHELNPELSNEPDDNFGLMEAIRGYIVPIPLRYRQDDIRQYIDNLGRPDLYAKNYFNRQILRWNSNPENRHRQIYKIGFNVTEIHRTRRREPYEEVRVYTYLKTLRGDEFVSTVDERIDRVINGLNDRRDSIEVCRDVDAVERAIEERLRWQEENVENGGGA